MITNPIIYSPRSQRHVDTFNGLASHWDGTCETRKAFRKEVREYYKAAQDYTCPYCGRHRQEFHGTQWDIDHIIPKSSHTEYLYTPKNLTVTCKDCNIFKSNKDPLTCFLPSGTLYPNDSDKFCIIHPHIDDYQQHLELKQNKKGQYYHNVLTDKGKKTFEICNLIRFSEVLSGTSEYVDELGTEVGITSDFTQPIMQWLEDYDELIPQVAKATLQEIIQQISNP
ncbi:HNH endonuclease [Tatumella saanichensis]|uniref:HNH endonuclease n=1 Tax=Tatumella saanichensis TaxID=480813 RepID=UPI0004A3532C|nr:HNH endonuclease [Tatumella saanichensis]